MLFEQLIEADVFRYPKSLRLLSSSDYRSFFSVRKKKHFRAAGLELSCVATGSQPRLGLLVPKRYLSRACDRNLLKRLCRECFRHRYLVCFGYDVVIRMLSKPEVVDRRILRLTLVALFDRLNHSLSLETLSVC